LPTSLSSQCELRTDPRDECCKVMFCPADTIGNKSDDDERDGDDDDMVADRRPVALLPFDGCVFKNRSYGPGERFYDGCEQQCQCMGYGDMVCLSRCPPTAPAPGQNCYTLPDASDPCCNITVCDKPFLDPEQNVRKEEADDGEVLKVQADADEDEDSISFGSVLQKEGARELVDHADGDEDDDSITLGGDEEGEEEKKVSVNYEEDKGAITIGIPTEDDDKQGRIVTAGVFREKIPGTNFRGLFIGDFQNHFHDIDGALYALNETALFIKNFKYDGGGPDAFFWAGTEGNRPSGAGGVILPYPYEGVHYPASSDDAPILGRANGDKDVLLILPDNMTIDDIRWLSVWCRAFGVNFGDVIFPDNVEGSSAIDAEATLTLNKGFNKPLPQDEGEEEARPRPPFADEEPDATPRPRPQFPDEEPDATPRPRPSFPDEEPLDDDGPSRPSVFDGTKELQPVVAADGDSCLVDGQRHGVGEDFYVGCEKFCTCDAPGSATCHPIKCPSKFGLDVINPFCLKWDEHEGFQPTPPLCCAPVPVCLSDGRCEYKGEKFNNFDNIPARLSGCERRCFCENGEVRSFIIHNIKSIYPLPSGSVPSRMLQVVPGAAYLPGMPRGRRRQRPSRRTALLSPMAM